MAKTKSIRTIADLQSALLLLIGGQGRAAGKKHIVEACTGNTRSVTTFCVAELYWRLPEDRGGHLSLTEVGDDPADAYRKCCQALRQELESRAAARRLEQQSSQPQLTLVHVPLRITHQPESVQ